MKMIKYALLILALITLIACSTDKTPIESVTHEEGWSEVNSEVFHAQKVVLNGAVSCRSCHGENVDSGQEDTFCQDCHKDHLNATYPHRNDWNIIGDPDNHASYLNTKTVEPNCISCHGGTSSSIARACSSCHIN